MSLHERCFAFEADFVDDLRCLPMAVRRKLDLAGVKLKLSHWHGLDPSERGRLLAWADGPEAITELRQWLKGRSAKLADGPAKDLEPAIAADWQQVDAVPERLRAACEQLGTAVELAQWQDLDELERFALAKLSHPGHEHRNLPRALKEFGLGSGWA
ncbi:nitrate reductase associated protein [Synechococcus sp. CS-1329]|jgi:hypothetical protein|uniref:nitrate reductase associated protein n=1 Tax=Synechococcus sp. CS-1329 TaxID=2847975 RepID=UPI00223B4F9C|nr:nitrate reductase associated protein [Synechococcus sp. CS-1329]MCT0218277.1 nitrate reductase associated protein [Synechococcus sp. CS-1329]